MIGRRLILIFLGAFFSVVLSSCSRCCFFAAGSLRHLCLSLFVYTFLDLFQHVVQDGPERGK